MDRGSPTTANSRVCKVDLVSLISAGTILAVLRPNPNAFMSVGHEGPCDWESCKAGVGLQARSPIKPSFTNMAVWKFMRPAQVSNYR